MPRRCGAQSLKGIGVKAIGDDIYVGIGTQLHRMTQDGQIVWSATLHEQENLVASIAMGVPGALRQADG